MKCALIAPTDLLLHIQPFSHYHLVLTHKVIYDSKYRDFYRERSRQGDYVLLDNSAREKRGKSMSMKDVVLAALLVKPAVVFLPDNLFDAEGTLDGIESALRSPHIRMLRKFIPELKLAVVVQGIDADEWLECFEILNGVQGINMLGIPMLTTHLFGSRLECLSKIAGKVSMPCHLLGAMDNLECTVEQAKFPFVVGIDTSKPVKLAARGISISQGWLAARGDREFIERTNHCVDLELLRDNCERFVGMCGSE